MANLYVRSTDGNNADSGATWALAKATLAGAMSAAAAGDTIYVSQAHAETGAGTMTSPGTLASPVKVIVGDDAAEPPTAVATASITSTAATVLILTGHNYVRGVNFFGDRVIQFATSGGNVQRFEVCSFRLSSAFSGYIKPGDAISAAPTAIYWHNVDVKFGSATQYITPPHCRFIWRGGSLLSGGTSPTNLLTVADARGATYTEVSGVDLSAASATMNLVGACADGALIIFRNCKLPTSWSGSLYNGTMLAGLRVEMYNCDNADTNYRIWIEDYCGSIRQETTIVRTGGASDGTTGLAWEMVSSANAEYPLHRLESGDIAIWNDTTGAAKTLTVEIVHDSQGAGSGSKFQDDEIWLEIMHLGTAGFPLGTPANDAKADVLAAAANQADSTETWTTTGLTSPVKQALSVTFTPQEKGYVIARVVLAKASKTVYVCPKATLA